MNVASLDLCKELYELSGWTDTPRKELGSELPVYDLGYLLRQLPPEIDIQNDEHLAGLELEADSDGTWAATYEWYDNDYHYQSADTPEDAAAKLAIELFKSGVLSHD